MAHARQYLEWQREAGKEVGSEDFEEENLRTLGKQLKTMAGRKAMRRSAEAARKAQRRSRGSRRRRSLEREPERLVDAQLELEGGLDALEQLVDVQRALRDFERSLAVGC